MEGFLTHSDRIRFMTLEKQHCEEYQHRQHCRIISSEVIAIIQERK